MKHKKYSAGIFSVIICLLVAAGFPGEAFAVLANQTVKSSSIIPPSAKKEVDEVAKARISASYGKMPLYFIQNDGQMDK